MSTPLRDLLVKPGSLSLRRRPEEDVAAMNHQSWQVTAAIAATIALWVVLLVLGVLPGAHGAAGEGAHAGAAGHGTGAPYVPPLWAVAPFVALLLAIAVLPLIPATAHWWESNAHRLWIAAGLGLVTLLFYGTVHPGGIANHFTHAGATHAGWDTAGAALSNALLAEFVPFIVLLFALYVISGGINLRGDLPARPLTNCAFIGIGGVLASFIGTTGAAMVLIRPLLATNAERKHKVHTVVFFIFVVCNCGGLLLPIGDPPLFLGYLRGVPFLWTLRLLPYWLGVNLALLALYWILDARAYRREAPREIRRDEMQVRPLQLSGKLNLVYLLGVVLCVGLVVPGEPLYEGGPLVPVYLREALMLALVGASLMSTSGATRLLNRFNYHAILEVAALFCGIFVCMQVPIEILNLRGGALGIDTAREFFWSTGLLSSFLDNAPTYVVFFETASALSPTAGEGVIALAGGRGILAGHLVPISLGAVFMGAMTYIGNGPNFMVKSIAEQSGIAMPSFFGYMLYSLGFLLPVWLVLTALL